MERERSIFYAWTQLCKDKLLRRTLFFSLDANIAYETKFEIERLISMNSWMMSFALVQSTGQSKK